MARKELINILQELYQIFEEKVNVFFERYGQQIDEFIDEYVLELFVDIPFLENRIRSHRLTEKDIKIMSAKGYHIFDGDKGRFVKEIPEGVRYLFKK